MSRELVTSAERGDFVKSATLCVELSKLKARAQAAQAAHQEIDQVIKRSRLGEPSAEMDAETRNTIELLAEQVIHEAKMVAAVPEQKMARVIPLRRAR